MTREGFYSQVERLKSVYGQNAYPGDRTRLIYQKFCNYTDQRFEELCDALIANRRSAPMLSDFIEEMQDMDRRRKDQERYGTGSVLEMLREAEKKNKSADPDFVKLCVSVVDKYTSGRMTKKQFDEACDLIDQTAKKIS